MAKPKPRPENPKRMRLTDRDKMALQTIADHEGLMSRKQLAVTCFGGSLDWAKKRMRVLFENGYVRQPDETEMHRIPVGEWVYWLDRRGLEVVAGLRGETVPQSTKRVHVEAPQYIKIEHDLAINNFRLSVNQAVAANPALSLNEWINEKTLTHWADEVKWTQPNGRPAQKRFATDGYFSIVRNKPETGKRETFAYLLEIDMATHSNPAFADEKIRPGVVYLTSPVYEQRFGVKYGRFLVVTTGDERLENMMRQAGRIDGGEVFFFTTFVAVTPQTLFSSPIWRSSGKDQPFALIPS